MASYLYGASVQGIQDFIFQTNQLKEIVGASEIVKNIEKLFQETVAKYDVEIIMSAAGNIKAIFKNRQECKNVVLEFPKIVMQRAYGITISQAVISLQNVSYTQDEMNQLMRNIQSQKNKPALPLDMSIGLMKLNPRTAKPLINKDEDKSTKQKRDAYQKWLEENPRNKEFKEISDFSNSKNKIAVIHIDANGLGKLIPNLQSTYKINLSDFSKQLDSATKKAFEDSRDDSMYIREIIIGGDDVSLICNANDALSFTKKFLENFEKKTAEIFNNKNRLTACAGIAYANEKYPFHYALSLADALCSVAKDHSKREHSCLMLHNIQSANFQSWNKIIQDELTIKNNKQTIRCDFGAYYINKDNEADIANLINTVEAYRCEGSPISRLREWLGELHKNDMFAKNLLNRINKVTQQKGKWNCDIMNKNLKFFHKELSNETLLVQKDGILKTPIYDILQILSATEATNGNA